MLLLLPSLVGRADKQTDIYPICMRGRVVAAVVVCGTCRQTNKHVLGEGVQKGQLIVIWSKVTFY